MSVEFWYQLGKYFIFILHITNTAGVEDLVLDVLEVEDIHLLLKKLLKHSSRICNAVTPQSGQIIYRFTEWYLKFSIFNPLVLVSTKRSLILKQTNVTF